MQTLPITPTAQPVTPAQASSSADNNTAQAAESFDSVLARQRTNADEPKSGAGTRDKNQPISSSSGSFSTDSAPVVPGNELEAPVTAVINVLPGDMLVALLPATTNTSNVATHKKPVAQAPTPDGISTMPGDMLAALLSTSATIPVAPATTQQDTGATTQQPITIDVQSDAPQQPIAIDMQGGVQQQPIAVDMQGGVQQQPIAAGVRGGMLQQPVAAGVRGDIRQQPIAVNVPDGKRQKLVTADIQSSAQQSAGAGSSIGEQAISTQSRNMPPAADTQSKTFSTVLETLGKDAANTAQAAGAAQISTQAALPDAISLASSIQSTTSPIAASANGPVQAVVNTPVTHEAWGNEFNQKITWLATQHEQTAELHLNPPHLGPMDVVLNISGDQATALFTSAHAAVRDAVEQALPKLREMLADSGITLGNATVSDQTPKEQPTWLAGKPARGNENLSGETGDAVSASGTAWPTRRHQGMVDTFA